MWSSTVSEGQGSESGVVTIPKVHSLQEQGCDVARGMCIPDEAAQGGKGLVVSSGPIFTNAINKNNLTISVKINSVLGQKKPNQTKPLQNKPTTYIAFI